MEQELAVPSLPALGRLSGEALEERLKKLAAVERKALALLLVHLAEFDERRLHEDRGYPSLFAYCLTVLGYSEQAAYKRIQAARASRAHPEILRRLDAGTLTLTAVVILGPHLPAGDAGALLDEARGRRTRELEAIAARLAPRPDEPDFIRALPAPAPRPEPPPVEGVAHPSSGAPASDPRVALPAARGRSSSDRIKPLSAGRSLIRFTGGATFVAKIARVRELRPFRRGLEHVMEAGLDSLLEQIDPMRREARRKSRRATVTPAAPARSRWIPRPIRDAVYERDGGRCVFTGSDGARCPARAGLQIDHIRPYALGGRSDDPNNLRLLCGAHNRFLARRIFGAAATGYPQG